MKRYVLVLATIAALSSQAQINYLNVCVDCNNLWHQFDFNSATDSTTFFFSVDTTQPNNLWQLGVPAKTVFNSGYWGPKAFVTDTLNPYPVNNVSSFQLSMINCSWQTGGPCGSFQVLWIAILTKINTDSSFDGGTIEVSHNGSSWINIISDSLAQINGDIYSINDTIRSMNKPGYSGTDITWKLINIMFFSQMSPLFDTITLRFTFASDSNQTNKDGWMIGMIQTDGLFEGIEEFSSSNLISVSPNPVSGELHIRRTKASDKQIVQILNYTGQVLYSNTNFVETIDTRQLDNGVYLLKYSNSKNISVKKFVVSH